MAWRNDQTLAEPGFCPDCGNPLTRQIEGFRPATSEEQRRLTPQAIRLLGLRMVTRVIPVVELRRVA